MSGSAFDVGGGFDVGVEGQERDEEWGAGPLLREASHGEEIRSRADAFSLTRSRGPSRSWSRIDRKSLHAEPRRGCPRAPR